MCNSNTATAATQQQHCNSSSNTAATSSEPHGRQAFFFVLFVFGIPCWLAAPKKGPTRQQDDIFPHFFLAVE